MREGHPPSSVRPMPFRRPAKLSFRTRQPSAGHSPLEDGKKRLAKEEAAKAATEAALGFLVVLAAVCLPMLPRSSCSHKPWPSACTVAVQPTYTC